MNYSTKITSIGSEVEQLERENGLIVVFNDTIEDDLRDISVTHTVADFVKGVKPGDYVAFGNRSYKITAVGNEVNFTMKTMGHCTFDFNGSDTALLPNRVSLDNKPARPKLKVGDLFEIIYR